MKAVIFSICILVIGGIHQVYGQSLTVQQKLIIEKQVDSAFHEMIKLAETIDYDKLNQGVTDKYNAGFIVNSNYYSRFDSLVNTLKVQSQGLLKQSITLQKEKITLLSDKIALITAFGETKVDVTSGNTFYIKFFWSFVYEKESDRWKVIQSHQSSLR